MTMDAGTCALFFVDASHAAHDGSGWYYVDDEYPEEGACGAFVSEQAAREHAVAGGYIVRLTKGWPE